MEITRGVKVATSTYKRKFVYKRLPGFSNNPEKSELFKLLNSYWRVVHRLLETLYPADDTRENVFERLNFIPG